MIDRDDIAAFLDLLHVVPFAIVWCIGCASVFAVVKYGLLLAIQGFN